MRVKKKGHATYLEEDGLHIELSTTFSNFDWILCPK